MCELMAMSFERPVVARFALREFGPRSDENPDGWGLGWYSDRSLALVKEPVKWTESPTSRFLENTATVSSRIVLAHVRHKTMGGAPNHADTHPFSRELGGRDYCFAHNGTLDGLAWDLPLGAFQPIGDTDSERFFCHLLSEITKRGGRLDEPADWNWLHAKLSDANRFGKLNVLLSDGQRLFVYHDVNGWKGLNYLRMFGEGWSDHRRVDTAHQPSLEPGKDLGMVGGAHPTLGNSSKSASEDPARGTANHGVVVATCPLSSSGWHSFQLGELIVIDAGQVRFSSYRDRSSDQGPRNPFGFS
jgi:glutamine amidotransferase